MNPRIHLRFVPTRYSRTDLVGSLSLSVITRQVIRRGSFTVIVVWNVRLVPFGWTRTAVEILERANRGPSASTDHWAQP